MTTSHESIFLSKSDFALALPQPLELSLSPSGIHSIVRTLHNLVNGYHCGADWQWFTFGDVCSSWSWKIWRTQLMEYFGSLQTATNRNYIYVQMILEQVLISCNRPCHQRRWNMPTLHRSRRSQSFNHWLVCLQQLVCVSWLVGCLENWFVN